MTALTTLLTDLAAPQYESAMDAYLEAVSLRHDRFCGYRFVGSSESCTCYRERLVSEATASYRQSYERIAALGLRFFSVQRVEAELRR
jgi:hypothetical protein